MRAFKNLVINRKTPLTGNYNDTLSLFFGSSSLLILPFALRNLLFQPSPQSTCVISSSGSAPLIPKESRHGMDHTSARRNWSELRS